VRYDVVVIGGGFFGCRIALELSRYRDRVLVLERGEDIMQRASYANQARVHGGYHYPRSILTALRSRVNQPVFSEEYADCIDSGFEKYYGIARQFSKVSHQQFRLFCERIGAPIEPAAPSIKRLFSADLVDEVYRVWEPAFNAVKLKERLLRQMQDQGVELQIGAEAQRVFAAGSRVGVLYSRAGKEHEITAALVINCTYSRINHLNRASGLPEIPIKYEIAEIALVDPPAEMNGIGVTVMCGPFFSVMPFPARGRYSFSHVRYTPHTEWHEPAREPRDPYQVLSQMNLRTSFPKMLADARRYIPSLTRTKYTDSLFEIKAVLPQSEGDDSRPILYRTDHGIPGYTCVMGAKIDNIYDVIKELTVNAVTVA
jgi:glycine/D-amino acid oxidase-like deaminating enzyme